MEAVSFTASFVSTVFFLSRTSASRHCLNPAVVVTKIEMPQPPNGEELKKDLSLDKLKSFNNEELNAVLALCSKAEMLGLVGIELPKQKLQITNHSNCIVMVKEKLNELKAN